MFKYLLKEKWLFILSTLIKAVGSALQIGIAYVLQEVVNTAIAGNTTGFFTILISGFVGTFVLGLVVYLEWISDSKFKQKVFLNVKSDLYASIVKLNIEDFQKVPTATYISALTNDINLIETNYLNPMLNFIGNGLTFVGTSIYLFYISPWVALTIILSSFFMVLVPALLGKKLEQRQTDFSNSLNFFTNYIKDTFSCIEVIRSLATWAMNAKEFDDHNQNSEEKRFKFGHMNAVVNGLVMILAIISQMGGFAVAGYLVLQGVILPGMLLAAVQLANGIISPVSNIMKDISSVLSNKGVRNKIMDYINFKEEDKTISLISFDNAIEFKNVSFSYVDNKPVLKDFSYTICKGTKIAVVGESGSGKTTIIKLLLGFYTHYKGSITLDDMQIKDIDKSLYQHVGLVSQNVMLFNKSISDNIMMYSKYDKSHFDQVIKEAGLDKFISSLPEKEATVLVENGSNLSGGQKQRISIARTLIRNPDILVLDEITSALDSQTGSEIENELLSLDKTIITVTHKLNPEVMKKYDEIIVIDDGKILEHGRYEKLISNKSKFFEMSTNSIIED